MRTFTVRKNKRKIYSVTAILALSGISAFILGSVLGAYRGIFDIFGVCFFVSALEVYSVYGQGAVTVSFDERPDDISRYPKLYFRHYKGNHNITNKYAVIPINTVTGIEKITRRGKLPGKETNIILANIRPQVRYAVYYNESSFECAIVCDFSDEVAALIEEYIKRYSAAAEEDELY